MAMDPNKTAIERAFELARTGLYFEIGEIKDRLDGRRLLHRQHHRSDPSRPAQKSHEKWTEDAMECEFRYVFGWYRCDRKGQPCKVCTRVDFEAGS